jgi:hypothetical protein
MNAYSHEFEPIISLPTRSKIKKRWLLFMAILALLGVFIAVISISHYRSSYEVSVDKIGGVYRFQHEDGRSTNNYNYLIRAGGLPEKEELALYRQNVRDLLKVADLSVPDDIFQRDRQAIDQLAIAWYLNMHPEAQPQEAFLDRMVQELYAGAIRPAVDRKTIRGSEDEENLWRLIADSGQPKLRWVGDDGHLISWMVVYSAGDKRSFYDPLTNTIYLSSTRSIHHLTDELSHAEQFRTQPLRSYARFGWSLTKTWLTSIRTGRTKKDVYIEEYSQEGSFEYEAHSVIKPRKLKKHDLEHLLEETAKTTP